VTRAGPSRLLRHLARRLLFAAALVFLVSSGALLIARLAPGDLTAEYYGEAGAGSAAADRARAGLDRPLAAFYADWLSGAARLDFGTSWRYGRPVRGLVVERARNTAILAALALALATLAGVALGVVSGTGRGALARAIAGASVLALSVPPLVLSLALAWLAARTGWFPVGGMWSAPAFSSAEALARAASHLVLPVLALAVPVGATLERVQSRAIRHAMGETSIAAARARGVDEARLRWRHALRLSIAPLASVYGLVAAGLFSGSFAVEVVTAWPGLGRLMYDALLSRDVVLVAGCAAGGAVLVAASTLLSDAALAWADPRVGHEP
jgi:peptide/nickel transport system permease protein